MKLKIEINYEGDVNIISAHAGGMLPQLANILLASATIGQAEFFLKNFAATPYETNDPELKYRATFTIDGD